MSERRSEAVRKIIPLTKEGTTSTPAFASPPHREMHPDSDTVERSGEAIVGLLKQAAENANATCDRAAEHAHKTSVLLRAAEGRIKELEVDLRHYQDCAQRAEERAQRAESWLVRIHNDVAQRFFEPKVAAAQQSQR